MGDLGGLVGYLIFPMVSSRVLVWSDRGNWRISLTLHHFLSNGLPCLNPYAGGATMS